jgi:hypothetical protein
MGRETGDWSPESGVDRDCASGLVSSLVISVIGSGFDYLAKAQAERSYRRHAWPEAGVLRLSEMKGIDAAVVAPFPLALLTASFEGRGQIPGVAASR